MIPKPSSAGGGNARLDRLRLAWPERPRYRIEIGSPSRAIVQTAQSVALKKSAQ